MSYEGRYNSGSPINNPKYNYFIVHSDENSKYFDNENKKDGETSNNINNNIKSGKYTAKRVKSKNISIQNLNKNDMNSPSIDKSGNNLDYHSKIFQR